MKIIASSVRKCLKDYYFFSFQLFYLFFSLRSFRSFSLFLFNCLFFFSSDFLFSLFYSERNKEPALDLPCLALLCFALLCFAFRSMLLLPRERDKRIQLKNITHYLPTTRVKMYLLFKSRECRRAGGGESASCSSAFVL